MQSTATRTASANNKSYARPGRRRRVRPRRGKGGRPRGSPGRPSALRLELERRKVRSGVRRARRALESLRRHALDLFRREEVEALARQTGFYQRTPRSIRAFEFVLCSALAAVGEGKRGFASVWRMLAAAAGVKVARSAVTQRFGASSSSLLEAVFTLAVQRMPKAPHPELLSKLKDFRAVLGDDATVVMLSPLLCKLFPATRTHSVAACGKVHVRADLVQRRVLDVVVTGEREAEVKVSRTLPVEKGTLYLRDLGYTDYDELARILDGGGELVMRLKQTANPRVIKVRHGLRNAAEVVGRGHRLNDPELFWAGSRDTFDLDAEFRTREHGPRVLRVVGRLHPETGEWRCYLTSLPAEEFSVEEVATLYSRRWVIELIMKLLKSSCHLDHVDTSDPGALRTHLYASLLAATILSALTVAAARAEAIPCHAIRPLVVGIAAPLVAIPLLLLWLHRRPTPEELADVIVRVIAIGCLDQNPNRTEAKWGALSRR